MSSSTTEIRNGDYEIRVWMDPDRKACILTMESHIGLLSASLHMSRAELAEVGRAIVNFTNNPDGGRP